MELELQCQHCGTQMTFIKREWIQFGQTSFLTGQLGNLLAGALNTDIYVCPACGKLEFYWADLQEQQEKLARDAAKQKAEQENQAKLIVCPKCGRRHHQDYKKCPYCKYQRNKGPEL